jgi:hypothetical protein
MMGWNYKTGEHVRRGDRVKISKRLAKEHGAEEGSVTDLYGFITVTLTNGVKIDLDARSVTLLSRAAV